MDIKKQVDPNKFEIGVVIARFQVHELHQAHKQLINLVCKNHEKVIIFLGVSRAPSSKRNPMDFATRKMMVQAEYPNVVILPEMDQRYDEVWSNMIDAQIAMPFGQKSALLYGSRDSFIPHYKGKHTTIEITSNHEVSGTKSREEVSKKILSSPDFRAGIIYANHARRAVTFSTVDVAIYNDKGQILLAKKPNEPHWRFVGGFVDRTDKSDEQAVYREAMEETNGCHIDKIKYVLSHQVDDWRYRKEGDGIMTRLYLARFGFGNPIATDDIKELKWFDISNLTELKLIKSVIMEEHQEMMVQLIEKIYAEKLVPNLGEFYVPKKEMRDPEAVVEDTTYKPK